MEAVGSQVFTVLLPLFILLGLAVYKYQQQILRFFKKIKVYIFGDDELRRAQVNRHPAFGAGQCSICLAQPKKFEVSSTCGHSFCCECIFSIYERNEQKILCPLCRKPITTMFQSFEDNEEPAEVRLRMITNITYYNDSFDDNRPLIRRLQQFPTVLRRIGRFMRTPQFWVLFIRSIYFFRIVLLILTYFILPIDLIPESIFGLVGYIDDFLLLIIFILMGLVFFVPIYIRIRGNR